MTDEAIPLLDALQVADLMALDKGRGALYAHFVNAFLSDAGERIAALKAHAGQADAVALAAAAHALQGSAGNVGAARLAALFRRIQRAAKRNDLVDVNESLALLDAEYVAAREALRAAADKG